MTLKLVKNTETTSLAGELMMSPRFQMFVRRLAKAQAIAEADEKIRRTAETHRVAAESNRARQIRRKKPAPTL